MNQLRINVSIRSEKAGRAVNEDSVLYCPNVSSLPDAAYTSTANFGVNDEVPSSGTLLAVADGPGSKDASKLALDSIKEFFAEFSSSDTPVDVLKKAITHADETLKRHAADDGTLGGYSCSLAVVWLIGDKAICGWCGDSRIYRFNPANGLVRLSHDHTYVQSLVDSGKITAEEAFKHPDTNLVTRVVGDCGMSVNPELIVYQVYENDTFLVCSDGLCNVLADPEISDILRSSRGTTAERMNSLWQAGSKAGWIDNATAIICHLTEGGMTPGIAVDGYPETTAEPSSAIAEGPSKSKKAEPHIAGTVKKRKKKRHNRKPTYLMAAIGILFIGLLIYKATDNEGDSQTNEKTVSYDADVVRADTRPVVTPGDTVAKDTVSTKHEHISQPKKSAVNVATTGGKAPASFVNNMASLNARKGEFDNIMRDGVMTSSRRKKIKSYTAKIASLDKECKRKKYRLSDSERQSLDALKSYANKLNLYLSQNQGSDEI